MAKRAKRKLKLALIGVGPRSPAQVYSTMWAGDATITAICDIKPEAIEKSLELFKELKLPTPRTYLNHQELLAREKLDGVMIASSWNSHVPLAIDCMRAGLPVSFEVGGATSLQQLWEMVTTSETTGVPCMMLENCCYGRNELMVLHLVRQGYFGEVIYCEGGYLHNLTHMVTTIERGKERVFHNLYRNGDLYPTHALGPISKILNINRGNRFLSLTATATKARGFANKVAETDGRGSAGRSHFNKGDVVTTVIKCANGEVITLKHCVSLPRPYSRNCLVQGTKGVWQEDANGISIEGITGTETVDEHGNTSHGERWEPLSDHYEKYDHPIWQEFRADIKGGHGGMDTLVLQGFFEAIRLGVQTPIDVYDTAAWMAITTLSEESVAMGSMPVPVPDFTNGAWIKREPLPVTRYGL